MNKLIYALLVVVAVLDCFYPLDVGSYVTLAIIDPGTAILAAAGIGAASNTVSGLLGISSQNSANAANVAMTKEQLAQQQKQFDAAMAWNRYQYEDQKNYNSIESQMNRARQAGVNPEFMLHGMTSGNVQSVAAPSPNASVVGGQVKPVDYSFVGNAINSGLQGYFDSKIKSEQAKQLEIDNFFRAQKNVVEIEKQMSDGRLNEMQRRTLSEQLTYNKKIRDEMFNQLKSQSRLLDLARENGEWDVVNNMFEAQHRDIMNKLAQWEYEYAQKHGEAELNQIKAIIRNLDSDSYKKNMEVLESKARAKGIKLDNDSKESLAPLIKQATQLQNDKTAAEAEKTRFEAWYGKNPWEFMTRSQGRDMFGYPAPDYLRRTTR